MDKNDTEYRKALLNNLPSLISIMGAVAMWEEITPYDWQRNVIESVLNPEDGAWTYLVTPNEGGKTSMVVKNLGLAFMTLFPAGQVVSTAGAFRQIEEQLWPTVRASVAPFPDWRITDDTLRAPPIDGLPGSKWTIFSTNDPNKAEGYHTRYYTNKAGETVLAPLLYIIDEAKGVQDEIFNAMIRCDPDFVLVCSTPGEETGEFYNIKYRLDHNISGTSERWKKFEVGWSDCEHLLHGRKRATRELLIKERGIDDPFVQSMVFGKFYRKGGYFIFNTGSYDICASGSIPYIANNVGAGVELAAGGDEVVFAYRVGNKLHDIQTRVDRDTARTSRWLESLFRKHGLKPEEIRADAGGLGKPIIDELRMRGWKGIQEYKFDDKPRDSSMFDSRGMEDHWHLAMHVDAKIIGLIENKKLREQVRLRRFELPNNSGNRMRLEPKEKSRKKGLGSPDRLDALVMAFSSMPDIRHLVPQNELSEFDKLMKKSGLLGGTGSVSVRGMLCET